MWKGKEREEWDRNAALQYALLTTGLSKPKRIPKLDDLNPIRNAEKDRDDEMLDDFDQFTKDIEKALR